MMTWSKPCSRKVDSSASRMALRRSWRRVATGSTNCLFGSRLRISDFLANITEPRFRAHPFWALTGNGGYTRAASNVLQARPCLCNGDLKNAPVEYFRKQVRLGG